MGEPSGWSHKRRSRYEPRPYRCRNAASPAGHCGGVRASVLLAVAATWPSCMTVEAPPIVAIAAHRGNCPLRGEIVDLDDSGEVAIESLDDDADSDTLAANALHVANAARAARQLLPAASRRASRGRGTVAGITRVSGGPLPPRGHIDGQAHRNGVHSALHARRVLLPTGTGGSLRRNGISVVWHGAAPGRASRRQEDGPMRARRGRAVGLGGCASGTLLLPHASPGRPSRPDPTPGERHAVSERAAPHAVAPDAHAERGRVRPPLASRSARLCIGRRANYAVELTLACDLACRHCGSRAGRARPDELTTEEALDLQNTGDPGAGRHRGETYHRGGRRSSPRSGAAGCRARS